MAALINWKKVAIPSGSPDVDHIYVGIDSADGVLYLKDSAGTITKYASTTDITTAINNLINGAPSNLNTLSEIAAAINNDPAFSTTVATNLSNGLATKQPLDSDLTALAGLTTTGILVRTGSGTAATRFIAVSTGLGISQPDGVAGNPTIFNADTGSAAVSAHVALSDPHTQYALDVTTISAGTSLNGGGDLSANRTINHNAFGTAATYGSASTVPVFTTETTGHITGVVNTAISITSSAITNFATTVLATLLTGYVVGTSAAIAATDSILVAFGKVQAQINAILGRTISAGTALNGGGDLSANRTINHNAFGTAGTYGSASAVPVLTTEVSGHVTAVASTPISILSTAVSDFAAGVRAVVLTGLSIVDSAITATDTVLSALGKLQGQINGIFTDMAVWTEKTTTADIITNSILTYSNVTELSFSAVAGKTYYIEVTVVFRTAATGTGITLSLGTPDGAAGQMQAQVNIPIAADGTAAIYGGMINSLGDPVTSTGVQTAQPTWNVANIKGSFICTTSGTVLPQFRSEVALSNVNFGTGSIILVREF